MLCYSAFFFFSFFSISSSSSFYTLYPLNFYSFIFVSTISLFPPSLFSHLTFSSQLPFTYSPFFLFLYPFHHFLHSRILPLHFHPYYHFITYPLPDRTSLLLQVPPDRSLPGLVQPCAHRSQVLHETPWQAEKDAGYDQGSEEFDVKCGIAGLIRNREWG